MEESSIPEQREQLRVGGYHSVAVNGYDCVAEMRRNIPSQLWGIPCQTGENIERTLCSDIFQLVGYFSAQKCHRATEPSKNNGDVEVERAGRRQGALGSFRNLLSCHQRRDMQVLQGSRTSNMLLRCCER